MTYGLNKCFHKLLCPVVYTQFYNAARCCPTRASLLTGMYPHKAGIGHMTSENPNTFEFNQKINRGAYQGYIGNHTMTIAEVLKESGYQTFMTGKWHVGHYKHNWPIYRGFDRYFGIIGGASNHFKPEKERQLLLDGKPYEPLPSDFYSTDYFTQFACEFVEEADPEDPFFLYLAYTAPHWPLHAWPEDVEKYKDRYLSGWDALREERFQKQKEMGLFPEELELSPRDSESTPWEDIENKEEWAHRMAVYAAMVDRVDQGIGRLLDTLEEKGELDNTLIFFLSDNGACAECYNRKPNIPAGPPESDTGYFLPWANASNTPFRLFKHWLHEGGSCTPLIVHWPDSIAKGRIETDYYAHVKDIMGTCMDVAGASYPKTFRDYPLKDLDSVSMLPNILGEKAENEDVLCLEHEGNRAVRQGDWKLVSYYSEARGRNNWKVGVGQRTGDWELYNMKKDRTELQDLSCECPDKKEELKAVFESSMSEKEITDWETIQKEMGNVYEE